jgi:hypothetical protein
MPPKKSKKEIVEPQIIKKKFIMTTNENYPYPEEPYVNSALLYGKSHHDYAFGDTLKTGNKTNNTPILYLFNEIKTTQKSKFNKFYEKLKLEYEYIRDVNSILVEYPHEIINTQEELIEKVLKSPDNFKDCEDFYPYCEFKIFGRLNVHNCKNRYEDDPRNTCRIYGLLCWNTGVYGPLPKDYLELYNRNRMVKTFIEDDVRGVSLNDYFDFE